MLGMRRFSGEDAVLRFFGRFAQGWIDAFFRPLWRWLLAMVAASREGFTLDLDSTVFNREGSQEGAANRPEDALTLWRDYNGRATIEQRIEELKNDLHADGFCTERFFATEAAFPSVIFAYNLMGVYQAQVTRQSGWRQPATLRAAVFVCGAVLGCAGRRLTVRLSQTGGGLARHKPSILNASEPPKPIAPLLPRLPILAGDLSPVELAACAI